MYMCACACMQTNKEEVMVCGECGAEWFRLEQYNTGCYNCVEEGQLVAIA